MSSPYIKNCSSNPPVIFSTSCLANKKAPDIISICELSSSDWKRRLYLPNSLDFGNRVAKPVILQNEVQGVGRLRRDSKANSPLSRSIFTPKPPKSGRIRAKVMQSCSVCSVRIVSGLRKSINSPVAFFSARLFAFPKPRL